MALIEIRGLTKLYRMGDSCVRALDGVDLTIERGEFVAITGASGSGKSTMMHLLGCLDRPTAGNYRLDNREVGELSDRELAAVRNQLIGFVFQTFNLINRTTATENVEVPLFYARKANTRPPSLRALERVGLANRAGHQPNELSGGERQRVAIARAIVNDPLLVLADEPTGNLDSRTGDQIMAIFHELNAQGVTIIMVTHEPDIAHQARRIVQMRDGHIVSDRRTADVESDERAGATPGDRAAQDVAAAETPSGPPVTITPRRVRGAVGAFIAGCLAMACTLTSAGLFASLAARPEVQNLVPGQPVPDWIVATSGAGMLLLVVAIGVGITAVVLSRGALRRVRSEPGAWYGRGWAIAGQLLGWLAIAIPVVSTAVSSILQSRKGG